MKMLSKLNTNIGSLETIKKQIDSMFDQAFSDFGITRRHYSPQDTSLESYSFWQPSVDAYEEPEKYVVKAALPGIDKDDVSIEVEHNSIRISGEKKYQNQVKEENLYRNEIAYGKFSRCFGFEKSIDVEKVKADIKNGMLTIELPKEEKEKSKSKTIKIS